MDVLLVDDHAVVRAGYRRLLEQGQGIRVVAEASDAEEGYSAWLRHRPDVSVVDLNLPGVGGFELLRRILARDAAARVLVFSMHEDPLFAARALEGGAKGYLTKRSAPEAMVDAVSEVANGRTYLSADIAGRMRSGAADPDPLAGLSLREIEILRRIAGGESPPEIARGLHLSQKTIANYQTQIKEKLGVGTVAALVRLAIRHGLVPADAD